MKEVRKEVSDTDAAESQNNFCISELYIDGA